MTIVKGSVLILLGGLLIHCGPLIPKEQISGLQGEQEEVRVPDAKHPKTPTLPIHYACYPGSSGEGLCLEVLELDELPENPQDYLYLDPLMDEDFPPSFDPQQYRPPSRVLDASRWPHYLQLSPHFKISELIWPHRGRFGLYSAPALDRIELIRESLGNPMIVTSAYRNPGHNFRIGGARWSRHTYGDALDFYSPGVELRELAQLCLAWGASFFQLYRSHVHCDWRSHPLDSSFFPLDEDEAPRLPLSPSQASQAFESVIHQVTQASQLQLHIPLSQSARELTLEAKVPQEDGGELLYEWSITLPTGHQLQSRESQPQVRRMPGHYQVEVLVGGSVYLEKNFFVSH